MHVNIIFIASVHSSLLYFYFVNINTFSIYLSTKFIILFSYSISNNFVI